MKITDTNMEKVINFVKLAKKVDSDEDQIRFLQETNIFPIETKCESCNSTVSKIYVDKNYHYFRCVKCKVKISVRDQTFLSKSRISLRKFILLVYIFVTNLWTYQQIQVIIQILLENFNIIIYFNSHCMRKGVFFVMFFQSFFLLQNINY